jgi:hypothetical protein
MKVQKGKLAQVFNKFKEKTVEDIDKSVKKCIGLQFISVKKPANC